MEPSASAQMFGIVVIAALSCGYALDLDTDAWMNVFAYLKPADVSRAAPVSRPSADAAASVFAYGRACSELILFRAPLPNATYLISYVQSLANCNSSRAWMYRRQIASGIVSSRRQLLVLERIIVGGPSFDVIMDALMILIDVLGVSGHHAIAIALRNARDRHVRGDANWEQYYISILDGLLQRGVSFQPVPPDIRTMLWQQSRVMADRVSPSFTDTISDLLRRHNVLPVDIDLCSIALNNDFPDPHIDADLIRVLAEHGLPFRSKVIDGATGRQLPRINHAIACSDSGTLRTLLSLGAQLSYVSFLAVSNFDRMVNELPTFVLDRLSMLVSSAASVEDVSGVLDQFMRDFPFYPFSSSEINALVEAIEMKLPTALARVLVLRSLCSSVVASIADLVVPATFAMPADDLEPYLSDMFRFLHFGQSTILQLRNGNQVMLRRPTRDDDMRLILTTAPPDAVYNAITREIPWVVSSNRRVARCLLKRFKKDPVRRRWIEGQMGPMIPGLMPPQMPVAAIPALFPIIVVAGLRTHGTIRRHAFPTKVVIDAEARTRRKLMEMSLKIKRKLFLLGTTGAIVTAMGMAIISRRAFRNASTEDSLPGKAVPSKAIVNGVEWTAVALGALGVAILI
ncbi:Uncharacterized protein PBTT_03963 [Plasmodiophora brassicae]